jgi:hypothetical protein
MGVKVQSEKDYQGSRGISRHSYIEQQHIDVHTSYVRNLCALTNLCLGHVWEAGALSVLSYPPKASLNQSYFDNLQILT